MNEKIRLTLAANNELVETRDFFGITKLQFANLSVVRADSNLSKSPGNRIRVTLQEKLDSTIVQVAYVSTDIFCLCLVHHKITKADSLHAT